jgi:hypothetical protein
MVSAVKSGAARSNIASVEGRTVEHVKFKQRMSTVRSPHAGTPTRGAVMAFQQGMHRRSYALDSQSAIMEVRRPSQTDYFSM